MEGPRPEKAAVVEDVRARFSAADAVILTEYRGLTVSDFSALRRSLAAAGGHYKVFKNTLVRRALSGGPWEVLSACLTGPTAVAFVSGEPGAVAKVLRDFSRQNASLVLKQGVLGEHVLGRDELAALAELPSREVLLACLAGGFAAPARQLASAFAALPRNFAYGLGALLDARRASGE